MNWNLILTTLVLLIMVIITTPVFMVMMLSYQKAKLSMISDLVNKNHMRNHPSSKDFAEDFDWSMFEGGAN